MKYRRARRSARVGCRVCCVTCPLEVVTVTMAGLDCVPWISQGDLYGHALYFFRFVYLV